MENDYIELEDGTIICLSKIRSIEYDLHLQQYYIVFDKDHIMYINEYEYQQIKTILSKTSNSYSKLSYE